MGYACKLGANNYSKSAFGTITINSKSWTTYTIPNSAGTQYVAYILIETDGAHTTTYMSLIEGTYSSVADTAQMPYYGKPNSYNYFAGIIIPDPSVDFQIEARQSSGQSRTFYYVVADY